MIEVTIVTVVTVETEVTNKKNSLKHYFYFKNFFFHTKILTFFFTQKKTCFHKNSLKNSTNSNCDKTQIWNGDITQNIKLWWNSKTQLWWNSNFDETQKLKLWWNSKTQILIKLKNSRVTKLKTSNWHKPQKLKSSQTKTRTYTSLRCNTTLQRYFF